MVLLQVFAQQGDVHAHSFGQDEQCAAHCQHWVKVLHRSVEGEITVARYAAVRVKPPLAADEMHEIEQCLVLDCHTLWLACGTGGVYHIGEAFWCCHRLCRHGVKGFRLVHYSLVHKQSRPGIFEHESHALFGINLVDWKICHTGFVRSEHRRHEPLVAVHAYGDELARLDAFLVEVGSELVGEHIQLLVCQFPVVVYHRNIIWHCLHLTAEKVEPCLRGVVVKCFALAH